jgi:hypothetical protein
MEISYPHLYSYTKSEYISLQSVLSMEELYDLFNLPLSKEAYHQYCELEILLQMMNDGEGKDKWKYIWGSGQYSSSKAYKHLTGSPAIHPAFRWLWAATSQPKHKVLFWLLLKNMLNTRGMFRRKNMALDSYDCELCLLQREEALRHLFFKCSFAKNCWSLIGVNVPSWLKPERATRHIKRQLRLPFSMDIIITMCWSIWSERNSWLFSNEDPQPLKCKEKFTREFALVIHRAKKSLVPHMQSWLSHL